MQKVLLSVALMLGVVAAPGYAAGDAAAGKAKSATCMGCHGMDGNSPAPTFPKLAGQHAGYLYKQLKDYKSGQRANPTMMAMVANLSDTDMQNLAAYYAEQTISPGTAAADQVELGKTIYHAGISSKGVAACAACHGPTGAGNPQAGFPRVSGQHAAYAVDQLKQFSQGARANDMASMMRTVAAKMSEAEMQAVAEYMQGLR
ncbi:MAG: c-type cytochrome [Pseudomonadota bacterium]